MIWMLVEDRVQKDMDGSSLLPRNKPWTHKPSQLQNLLKTGPALELFWKATYEVIRFSSLKHPHANVHETGDHVYNYKSLV